MMIQTESTESRKKKAYQAGREFAQGSPDESCVSSNHFITQEIASEWERGCSDGEKEHGLLS